MLMTKRTEVYLWATSPPVERLADVESPCHERDESTLLPRREPRSWTEERNSRGTPNVTIEKTRSRSALVFAEARKERGDGTANEGLGVHPEKDTLREACDELLPVRLRHQQKKGAK
jgi:hypothetical protein